MKKRLLALVIPFLMQAVQVGAAPLPPLAPVPGRPPAPIPIDPERIRLEKATRAIQEKYSSLGGYGGVLGLVTSVITLTPNRRGYFQHYERGSIYWQDRIGAFSLIGAIHGKWAAMGWETSFLGFPTTDETATPDGIGRFNHFEGGSIYWKPSLGPVSIHGAIRDAWAAQGWELNPRLGYPIRDEAAGLRGRFSDFENGVLYWQPGYASAIPLDPFRPGTYSLTASEVREKLDVLFGQLVSRFSGEAYVDQGATLQGTLDYYFDGALHQRRVRFTGVLKYKAEALGLDDLLPDPYSRLEMEVELLPSRDLAHTEVYLRNYRAFTTVPAPTSNFIKAKDINARLQQKLDLVLHQPQPFGDLPAGLSILSVKTQPDGALAVYIEPIR